jgi:hypothetical protein
MAARIRIGRISPFDGKRREWFPNPDIGWVTFDFGDGRYIEISADDHNVLHFVSGSNGTVDQGGTLPQMITFSGANNQAQLRLLSPENTDPIPSSPRSDDVVSPTTLEVRSGDRT